VKRGHYVTYVTGDHYARQIAEVGAVPVLFSYSPPDKGLAEEIRNALSSTCGDAGYWKMARSFQVYEFACAEKMLDQVHTFYKKNAPDVILYDPFMIGARILARRLDCAVIRISPHFAQYERFVLRQHGVFRNPEGVLECRRDLDSFLLNHGITTTDNFWHVEKLNIQFIPREFQYCNDYFDERFCFVGALLDRPFKQVWKINGKGRPIVLISDLSGLRDAYINADSYYKLFIESLSDSACHCILSIGDSIDPHSLGTLPENFEINQRASHLEILPHAALSVCHGGMLSTLEALYNGVPVLAIPLTPGTEDVAYRTAELGLGIQLSRSALTTDKVRETVEGMLFDTGLQTRVKETQEVFRRSGGVKMAADRIEASLEPA